LRNVLGEYTLSHFDLNIKKNPTHTVAYIAMGAKLMKRAEKEAELTGVVGFRRGDTVVELSLADPTLGSSPCQKVNCCSSGGAGVSCS
jgi:hypothetical protein